MAGALFPKAEGEAAGQLVVQSSPSDRDNALVRRAVRTQSSEDVDNEERTLGEEFLSFAKHTLRTPAAELDKINIDTISHFIDNQSPENLISSLKTMEGNLLTTLQWKMWIFKLCRGEHGTDPSETIVNNMLQHFSVQHLAMMFIDPTTSNVARVLVKTLSDKVPVDKFGPKILREWLELDIDVSNYYATAKWRKWAAYITFVFNEGAQTDSKLATSSDVSNMLELPPMLKTLSSPTQANFMVSKSMLDTLKSIWLDEGRLPSEVLLYFNRNIDPQFLSCGNNQLALRTISAYLQEFNKRNPGKETSMMQALTGAFGEIKANEMVDNLKQSRNAELKWFIDELYEVGASN
ncbi:hypothetical protein Plhal304r1_c035g0108601 [Plasmopara halstedii]